MARHVIGTVDEIPPGLRKLVTIKGRSIGVFNVGGAYHAVRNLCPHQGAPLCLGLVGGTALQSQPGAYVWGRDGEILRCPWHGWEFDLLTGRALFDPHVRVKTYAVEVQGDQLVLIS